MVGIKGFEDCRKNRRAFFLGDFLLHFHDFDGIAAFGKIFRRFGADESAAADDDFTKGNRAIGQDIPSGENVR